jgi:hypothetical protein
MSELTHKGWLGFCPIYVGNLHGDSPLVVERWRILAPLLWFNTWIFGLFFTMATMIDPEYEPQWPLRITGARNE